MQRSRLIAPAAAAIVAAHAHANILYQNSLKSGQPPNWITVAGQWVFTQQGMTNTINSENRILADVVGPASTLNITFNATLVSGPGWSFHFRTGIDGGSRFSGLSFNYSPSVGTGAYILQRWTSDATENLLIAFAPLDLMPHTFDLSISASGLTAKRDGVTVMNYSGDLSSPYNAIGFRTYHPSSALFDSLLVQGVAIPAPAAAALFGLAAAAPRRRRST